MSVEKLAAARSIEFVCPDCKGELRALTCRGCGAQFVESHGIPKLLSKDPRFESASKISDTYDSIYDNHSNVWEDQGRPKDFISYMAGLVGQCSTGRVLEVGSGEGILMAAIQAEQKFAVDISALALVRTRQRSQVNCAVAIAERLPYPDASFDVAVSVGVMEHFLDDDVATAEIRRVLRPGGHYVALIHTIMTKRQRVEQKVREYLFPKFRPIALVKWLMKKTVRPIHQPVQIHYTPASGRACMERNGFVVQRQISDQDRPRPPLAGSHVTIYVSRNPTAG